jgi:NADH:ubiquinone oxidoreductase subunit F (NADH-binding)
VIDAGGRLSSCFAPGDAWTTLESHRRRFDPTPPVRRSPDDAFIAAVERSGLRGRGGAGFPTAVKLRAVSRGRRRPVVLVNGSEGEPASVKDVVLMSRAPHLVLDGALLAASAVGADEVVMAVKVGPARRAVARAVEERHHAEPWTPRIRIVDVPTHYLVGEERALVNLVNRGRPIPPPGTWRPFERGVGNRPTLVQNVETVAHLALIHRIGVERFRQVGHPDEPGTMLVTVGGAVRDPGVYEVPTGTAVIEVLSAAAGVADEQIEAVLVGGYGGAWLAGGAIERATLDRAGMDSVGGLVGCAAIVALPASACGVGETAAVMRWLATQTAGQCGPCVFGLDAIAAVVEDVWRGTAQGDAVTRLVRWAGDIEGRGACRLPDGAVRFLRSALAAFQEDVRQHGRGRPCRSASRGITLPIPGRRVAA